MKRKGRVAEDITWEDEDLLKNQFLWVNHEDKAAVVGGVIDGISGLRMTTKMLKSSPNQLWRVLHRKKKGLEGELVGSKELQNGTQSSCSRVLQNEGL